MSSDLFGEHSAEVSKTISLNALQNELGDVTAKSILKAVRKSKDGVKVPRHEDLNVGDVILTKPAGKQKPNISAYQASLGLSHQASEWTHAMLYIGNLHVLESNPPSIKNPRNGVRITPLVRSRKEAKDHLVLRHRSELFEPRRFPMVRRAMLEYHLARQRYDHWAVWDVFMAGIKNRRKTPELHQRVTCSEYILSCYANGAETLVEEYFDVHENEQEFFLPAHLYEHSDFQKKHIEFYDFEMKD